MTTVCAERASGWYSYFWVVSYPFIYYGTTFVRADPPMLLLLASALLLARRSVSPLWLFLVLSMGVLAHEMILVVVPFLWLDKFLRGTFGGG